jgi:hypothetical protein
LEQALITFRFKFQHGFSRPLPLKMLDRPLPDWRQTFQCKLISLSWRYLLCGGGFETPTEDCGKKEGYPNVPGSKSLRARMSCRSFEKNALFL